MSAGAGDLRTHQPGVFEWAGGVGAEIFGVVGEAEAGLFDGFGRKSFKAVGVGNQRLTPKLSIKHQMSPIKIPPLPNGEGFRVRLRRINP